MLHIEIGGARYEIPETAQLTFAEWRYAKLQTGLTAPEFEMALKGIDPDAWYVLCMIGMRRSGKTDDQIDKDLGALNFLGLFDGFADDEAVVPAGPPDGEAAGGLTSLSPEKTSDRPGASAMLSSSASSPGS